MNIWGGLFIALSFFIIGAFCGFESLNGLAETGKPFTHDGVIYKVVPVEVVEK